MDDVGRKEASLVTPAMSGWLSRIGARSPDTGVVG